MWGALEPSWTHMGAACTDVFASPHPPHTLRSTSDIVAQKSQGAGMLDSSALELLLPTRSLAHLLLYSTENIDFRRATKMGMAGLFIQAPYFHKWYKFIDAR